MCAGDRFAIDLLRLLVFFQDLQINREEVRKWSAFWVNDSATPGLRSEYGPTSGLQRVLPSPLHPKRNSSDAGFVGVNQGQTSGPEAAPVNTFLQQAIHRYTRAAETPVMNFNLLSAEGAAARGRLIKGKHPLQEEGVGVKVRGSTHADRLSPSCPRNYLLIGLAPQAGASEAAVGSAHLAGARLLPRNAPSPRARSRFSLV
ncbi:hypothetical protein AOLI_G00306570 [Acnodon oligacanthus]